MSTMGYGHNFRNTPEVVLLSKWSSRISSAVYSLMLAQIMTPVMTRQKRGEYECCWPRHPARPHNYLGFIICKISENHLYNWRQRGADRQGIQSAVGEIPFSGYRLQTLSHSSWSTHSILDTGNSIIQYVHRRPKNTRMHFGFLAFLRIKLQEGDI